MVLVNNLKLLDRHLQTTDMIPGLADVAAYPSARARVSLGTKHTIFLLLYDDNTKEKIGSSLRLHAVLSNKPRADSKDNVCIQSRVNITLTKRASG